MIGHPRASYLTDPCQWPREACANLLDQMGQELSDQRHMRASSTDKDFLNGMLFITCFSIKLQPKFITT